MIEPPPESIIRRDRVLAHQHGAADVDRLHLVPHGDVHVHHVEVEGGLVGQPRVVVEHVETAVCRPHGAEQRDDAVFAC